MPFVAYTAIRIQNGYLDAIARFVGEEEWAKSKDEMIKLADAYEAGDDIHYVLPDWTPHISCDHVTNSDTLFTMFNTAAATEGKMWITPRKK